MKKLFKRLMKRLYVKAMLWYRNSFYSQTKNVEDNEKICTSICRKLINHPDSKFLIAINSMLTGFSWNSIRPIVKIFKPFIESLFINNY